jgi:hypothetical protein
MKSLIKGYGTEKRLGTAALRHEDVWRSGCTDPRFLNLGTSWMRWPPSRPDRFTPREWAPGTRWIGWVDPRAVLDDTEKWKFLTLTGLQLRPLDHSARRQSLYRLLYRGSWCVVMAHYRVGMIGKLVCAILRMNYKLYWGGGGLLLIDDDDWHFYLVSCLGSDFIRKYNSYVIASEYLFWAVKRF